VLLLLHQGEVLLEALALQPLPASPGVLLLLLSWASGAGCTNGVECRCSWCCPARLWVKTSGASSSTQLHRGCWEEGVAGCLCSGGGERVGQ